MQTDIWTSHPSVVAGDGEELAPLSWPILDVCIWVKWTALHKCLLLHAGYRRCRCHLWSEDTHQAFFLGFTELRSTLLLEVNAIRLEATIYSRQMCSIDRAVMSTAVLILVLFKLLRVSASVGLARTRKEKGGLERTELSVKHANEVQ